MKDIKIYILLAVAFGIALGMASRDAAADTEFWYHPGDTPTGMCHEYFGPRIPDKILVGGGGGLLGKFGWQRGRCPESYQNRLDITADYMQPPLVTGEKLWRLTE